MLGAGAVLGRPLDVVDLVARARDLRDHHLAAPRCGSFWSLYFMCTGEVEMKVWMRLRLAGLTASAQRSMSLRPARDRPADDGVLDALGDLAARPAKSPSEAIGKPASMMSTPIVVEQLGDLELLLERHGGAGALLAVAQGGVEDDDAVLVGLVWRGHWI